MDRRASVDGVDEAGPRSGADVRASLERDARELRSALGELGRVTRAKIDLRQRVADHTGAVMLAGFVLGVLWGARPARGRLVVMTTTRGCCVGEPGRFVRHAWT